MPHTVRAKHLSGSSSSSTASGDRSSASSSSKIDTDSDSSSTSESTSSQAQDSRKKRRQSSPAVTQRAANAKQLAIGVGTTNDQRGRASQASASRHDDTVVTIPSALTEAENDASAAPSGAPSLRAYPGAAATDEAEASEPRLSSNWITLGFAIGGSAAVGVLFGKMFHWHETEKVAAIIGGSTALGIALWGLGKTAMALRNNGGCTQASA